jgi:hypothetical protein
MCISILTTPTFILPRDAGRMKVGKLTRKVRTEFRCKFSPAEPFSALRGEQRIKHRLTIAKAQ